MMKTITIIDTETTGLEQPLGTDLVFQPKIIEIYAAKINPETDEIIKEIDTLVNPQIPIPNFITKINGINDEMVKSMPNFQGILPKISNVFLGSTTSIGANLYFDESMLYFELSRIDKLRYFPWCPHKFCIIEQSKHIRGYRLKNTELYQLATGIELETAHRAKNDALATYEVYKWLLKQEKK